MRRNVESADDWKVLPDPSGESNDNYYWNTRTGETTWVKPVVLCQSTSQSTVSGSDDDRTADAKPPAVGALPARRKVGEGGRPEMKIRMPLSLGSAAVAIESSEAVSGDGGVDNSPQPEAVLMEINSLLECMISDTRFEILVLDEASEELCTQLVDLLEVQGEVEARLEDWREGVIARDVLLARADLLKDRTIAIAKNEFMAMAARIASECREGPRDSDIDSDDGGSKNVDDSSCSVASVADPGNGEDPGTLFPTLPGATHDDGDSLACDPSTQPTLGQPVAASSAQPLAVLESGGTREAIEDNSDPLLTPAETDDISVPRPADYAKRAAEMISKLPLSTGELQPLSLIAYLRPERHALTADMVRVRFAASNVTTIRVMGDGFVAVTCRDEASALATLGAEDGEECGKWVAVDDDDLWFVRPAVAGDYVDLYPVSMVLPPANSAVQEAEPATCASVTKEAGPVMYAASVPTPKSGSVEIELEKYAVVTKDAEPVKYAAAVSAPKSGTVDPESAADTSTAQVEPADTDGGGFQIGRGRPRALPIAVRTSKLAKHRQAFEKWGVAKAELELEAELVHMKRLPASEKTPEELEREKRARLEEWKRDQLSRCALLCVAARHGCKLHGIATAACVIRTAARDLLHACRCSGAASVNPNFMPLGKRRFGKS